MIRVLVADDHDMVRRGVCAFLERVDDIEVVGEAENGAEAIALTKEFEPDVSILDLSMPKVDGIRATKEIRALGIPTKIVILSMYSQVDLVKQVLKEGALGYVLKRSAAEELVQAIRAAKQNQIYLSSLLAPSLSNEASA
jgi:DNA-binding NarL/FixJ family response regulator